MKHSSPLVFGQESHFGKRKKRQVAKMKLFKQAKDKPVKQIKPVKGHPAKQELVDNSKAGEIAHLTRDLKVHIPALDEIHEDEAEGVQSKAKEVSKSTSESGKSSKSSVSIETSKEDKSIEESSQLQFGYHSFHRLKLNSEPNSMHDNSFEYDGEQKNANSEGDADG